MVGAATLPALDPGQARGPAAGGVDPIRDHDVITCHRDIHGAAGCVERGQEARRVGDRDIEDLEPGITIGDEEQVALRREPPGGSRRVDRRQEARLRGRPHSARVRP